MKTPLGTAQTTNARCHVTTNLLIMSNAASFRNEAIRIAIAQALSCNQKVLLICVNQTLQATFQAYQAILPQDRTRVMGELGVEIAPLNKPFLAFETWNVVISTPDYLHRQLTTPNTLIQQSVFREVGLIVLDGIDACANASTQALLELALIRFCLCPIDGVPRRVVVTLDPIQNAQKLANWLEAEIVSDKAPCNCAPSFTSAWDRPRQPEVLLTFLAGQRLATPEHIDKLVQKSFEPDPVSFASALAELRQHHAITYADTPGNDLAYRLTNVGETMARHRLSLADTQHLHRCLQIGHLAWLDLLIVAASTPDFPSVIASTPETMPMLTHTLETLHSTLLQKDGVQLMTRLDTTPAHLGEALKIALVGYYATRGWTHQRIATILGMEEAQVSHVICALRQRIRAMFTLTYNPVNSNCPLTQRLQTLWHMLTNISPKFLGLASLPDIRHWVIAHLTQANITTLTALIQLDVNQEKIDITPGLILTLQDQARTLLRNYPTEDHFLATFTTRFPLVREATPFLNPSVA